MCWGMGCRVVCAGGRCRVVWGLRWCVLGGMGCRVVCAGVYGFRVVCARGYGLLGGMGFNTYHFPGVE